MLRLTHKIEMAAGLLFQRGQRYESVEERVSLAYADTPKQLNMACYRLGVRHVEVEIGDTWVRYRQDPGLDAMVRSLGLTVTCTLAVFDPANGTCRH